MSAMKKEEILKNMDLPLMDLLFVAHQIHRAHFDANALEPCTLASIKTGGCPEDCAYCAQSARHNSEVPPQPLMEKEEVLSLARQAKAKGAKRFCMGAAWRSPKGRDLEKVAEIISEVRRLGLETCATLGMLETKDAMRLAEAGLDYYNHNIDTDPEFYPEIISTRTIDDRFLTLQHVRQAGIKICCGGIVGMGEGRENRAAMVAALASMEPPPESVPVNLLIPMPGTPLAEAPALDPFEIVRTIAACRLAMPKSRVRLSAGRTQMPDTLQALCFFAGANSIFLGEKLLTADNPKPSDDEKLLARLGMRLEGLQDQRA